MIGYIIRRIFFSIPILIGVNILTFFLFFVVNSPTDMAIFQLGQKYVSQEAIEDWKKSRGYDNPLFLNTEKSGIQQLTKTIFFEKSVALFKFDFGLSDAGRSISEDILQRMWPSLAIAIPTLIVGLVVYLWVALLLIFFRGTYLDTMGVWLSVAMMSISALFYIVGAQYWMAKVFQWAPISGYVGGFSGLKFLMLPIFVGVVGGLGASVRWYRTLFLEEINKDYVRTAKAKGLSESRVLLKHVFPNALIPILTGIVATLPLLFLGSLLTESFFGIPGLGSYTVDAINQQDFAIVRCMVFLGSLLYIIGLILTDISYTWADPRVRFS
jgi:peptide/nickel transport system permease protein